MPKVEVRIDPFPSNQALNVLMAASWEHPHVDCDFQKILQKSLAHVAAFAGNRLVGFVNVAWDGGVHAFILDTCVHPDFRRQGIARHLVGEARTVARSRGAQWLHVDFEPRLEEFYRQCGFRPTKAGLINLGE